jgi:hypothetical protein
VPIFAVVFFGDKMTCIKVVAMLMAVWGFLSYLYQHYLGGREGEAGGGRMQRVRGADGKVWKFRSLCPPGTLMWRRKLARSTPSLVWLTSTTIFFPFSFTRLKTEVQLFPTVPPPHIV